MKSFLKKIVPTPLLDYWSKRKYSAKKSAFQGKSTEETFTQIFKQNTWGSDQSISGQGSTLQLSESAINFMNEIIQELSITSILDLPCGDFHWMQEVNLSTIEYTGADIVLQLIDENQQNYGSDSIRFRQLDLIQDELPSTDLIIVRDCFVHFSFDDIHKALQGIKRSGIKYLVTTTFPGQTLNYDIVTGDWRPINLQRSPFNFPSPTRIQEENYSQEFKRDFRQKSLAIWEIDEIN